MAERAFGGLRGWLTFEAREPDPSPGEEPGHESVAREVEFTAYTEDCRVYGFVSLAADRLSDVLNEQEEYLLDSVLLVALSDNRAVELKQLSVRRDELVAVRAAGPRGNAARRIRTRAFPVAVKAGPYLLRGYVHGPPGGDALRRFRTQRPMVPLTGATIEYQANGALHRARVGGIIVNAAFIDWVDHAKDTDVRADLPVEMRIDPRAKDLTGAVRVASKRRKEGAAAE